MLCSNYRWQHTNNVPILGFSKFGAILMHHCSFDKRHHEEASTIGLACISHQQESKSARVYMYLPCQLERHCQLYCHRNKLPNLIVLFVVWIQNSMSVFQRVARLRSETGSYLDVSTCTMPPLTIQNWLFSRHILLQACGGHYCTQPFVLILMNTIFPAPCFQVITRVCIPTQ